MGPFEILLTIALTLPFAVFIAKICSRVGLPKWYGLLMLIPGLNYLVLGYIANTAWPLEQSKHK